MKGVKSVVSGYSGGHVESPTYEQVSAGRTGHAEVCQIEFDNELISFEELLEIFFQTHDPTTLNRQGNDIGTQYRSVIFYHNDRQKMAAEHMKQDFESRNVFKKPIVTEITAFTKFYPAESYHQDYFRNNPNQGYCRYVIAPKVAKFEKTFKLKLDK